jgi:RNA 2',3'-cyclic 3'-phosphodiesterase
MKFMYIQEPLKGQGNRILDERQNLEDLGWPSRAIAEWYRVPSLQTRLFMICSVQISFGTSVMSGIVGNDFMSDRLFFATVPDSDTASRIYRLAGILKRARKFEGELIGPERLHVTLFFLDRWRGLREHIVRTACEAAAEVRMKPFEVSFDRTSSFRGKPDNHPFVLLGDNGLSRLRSFRQTLGAAMMRSGLRQLVNTDFTPHVTLLYDMRNVEEQPIEPIFWTVSEFLLIHSMRGHAHLARWPLRD